MTSFLFILLLPLAVISSVTSELQKSLMDEGSQTNQLGTRQPSTSYQMSGISALDTTTNAVFMNTPKETSSFNPLLQRTQTMSPASLSMITKTASRPTSLDSTKTVRSKIWTSIATVLTNQSSKPTNNSTETLMLSNITQTHGTARASTSQIHLNKVTSFTSIPKLTAIFTSMKPGQKVSTTIKPSPGTNGTQSMTLETPTITYTTEAKKTDLQQDKVVAAVIGAGVSLMIVGFLLICIKKQRLQEQQITMNWAGPSPFLEEDNNNSNVALRSSNRVSFISFLPLRLSKRLSVLSETNEMEDMTPKATLEEKHIGSTFGQAMERNNAPEKCPQKLVQN